MAQNGATVFEEDEKLGEYGNLVRYISNFKDGRRMSTSGASLLDDLPTKKKWYQFGKKVTAADGLYETPPEWIQTDWKQGLTSAEVDLRRKKVGFNELTTEKENMFLTFVSYFRGPILYGMLMISFT